MNRPAVKLRDGKIVIDRGKGCSAIGRPVHPAVIPEVHGGWIARTEGDCMLIDVDEWCSVSIADAAPIHPSVRGPEQVDSPGVDFICVCGMNHYHVIIPPLSSEVRIVDADGVVDRFRHCRPRGAAVGRLLDAMSIVI